MNPTPVIDITDLYHPYQDPDDNLDLLMAFGLPEVELLGVILDAHEPFRMPVASVEHLPGLWADPHGPRDPGFIPVQQLNYIFDRSVPVALGPLQRMLSANDAMQRAPAFQQQGIDLLLDLLRESAQPVHVVSQGSVRPLAVAYNRDPELCQHKIARLHLCLGSTAPSFLEWNVALDVHAAVRLLRSSLPLTLYPPATGVDPFSLERHNCYWHLEEMHWVKEMHPKLRRYLDFVYERSQRADFLRAMDEDSPAMLTAESFGQGHHIWTTAIWMEISGRRLVPTEQGYRLRRISAPETDSLALPHALRRCELTISDAGHISVSLNDRGKHLICDRGEPELNAIALNQAFPALYCSFGPERAQGEDRLK